MKVKQLKTVALMAFVAFFAVLSFYYFLSFSRVEPYWGEHPELQHFNTVVIDVSVEKGISEKIDQQHLMAQASAIMQAVLADRHGQQNIQVIKGFSQDLVKKHPLAVFIFYRISAGEKGLLLKADIKRSDFYKFYEASLRHPDIEKEFADISKEKFTDLARTLHSISFTSEGMSFSSAQELVKNFGVVVHKGLVPYADVMKPEAVNALSIEQKMQFLD